MFWWSGFFLETGWSLPIHFSGIGDVVICRAITWVDVTRDTNILNNSSSFHSFVRQGEVNDHRPGAGLDLPSPWQLVLLPSPQPFQPHQCSASFHRCLLVHDTWYCRLDHHFKHLRFLMTCAWRQLWKTANLPAGRVPPYWMANCLDTQSWSVCCRRLVADVSIEPVQNRIVFSVIVCCIM